MDMFTFDTSQLDDFQADALRTINDVYPKQAKALMNKLGNVGRRNLRKVTREDVGKKTGNLLKGVRKGSPYKYNDVEWQIRYYNKMPHAHLIEHGHDIVGHKPFKVHYGERANAYHIGSKANRLTVNEIDSENIAGEFVDNLLKEGFGI